MLENRVKRIIREGGVALGSYGGSFKGPTMVEIIGHSGFDAVFIDMEHMPFDLADIQMAVMAAERVGITPIVRPPGFDPALILRLLDMGAQGIYVPDIADAAGARAAVQAVRFAPLGERGMMGYSRSADYGKIPMKRHLEESNREVLLAVMIESLEALDEIDDIAATEGVDLVAVGPGDMGKALGVAGEPNHPKLVAAVERIAEAVKKSGNAKLAFPQGHALMPRTISELKQLGLGYTNVGPAPEVRLMRSMSQQVADLHKEMG